LRSSPSSRRRRRASRKRNRISLFRRTSSRPGSTRIHRSTILSASRPSKNAPASRLPSLRDGFHFACGFPHVTSAQLTRASRMTTTRPKSNCGIGGRRRNEFAADDGLTQMRNSWFHIALEAVGLTEAEYHALASRIPALNSEHERLSRDGVRSQVRSTAFASAIRWAQGLERLPPSKHPRKPR
jgi:hypothetical protein